MTIISKALDLAKLKGWTQAELARRTRIRDQRITKWKDESDKPLGGPSRYQALRMARVLGVPLEYLVDDQMVEMPRVLTAQEQAILELIDLRGIKYKDVIRRLGIDDGEFRVELDRPDDQSGAGSSPK